MNNFVPHHKLTDDEMMILNIVNEGQGTVWKVIELERSGLERARQRKLFGEAVAKLDKQVKEDKDNV